MKHVCYTCGFVLRKGLPLLEDIIADREILNGTLFEDLSPYNFCAYCLHMVVEFPSAFVDNDYHTIVQRSEGIAICSCGHKYITSTSWVQNNRMVIAHKAICIYQDGDFNMAMELINADI